MHLTAAAASWMLASLQIVGLSSAVFARLSEGSTGQVAGQWLFMLSLALVGAGTVGSFALGAGWWLSSSATLALMILAATCDFSRCREKRLEAQV